MVRPVVAHQERLESKEEEELQVVVPAATVVDANGPKRKSRSAWNPLAISTCAPKSLDPVECL